MAIFLVTAWVRVLLRAAEVATYCSSLQATRSPGHRSPLVASKYLRPVILERRHGWAWWPKCIIPEQVSEADRQAELQSVACTLYSGPVLQLISVVQGREKLLTYSLEARESKSKRSQLHLAFVSD